MAIINDSVSALESWLAAQDLSAALREFDRADSSVAVAYPQLSIIPREELFAPRGSDVSAGITLRLSCAAGRPEEAMHSVRQLAQELRLALLASANLGGLVKALKLKAIRYQRRDEGSAGVTADAELDLELLYVQQ